MTEVHKVALNGIIAQLAVVISSIASDKMITPQAAAEEIAPRIVNELKQLYVVTLSKRELDRFKENVKNVYGDAPETEHYLYILKVLEDYIET